LKLKAKLKLLLKVNNKMQVVIDLEQWTPSLTQGTTIQIIF